jgi:hypothetical protein
VPRPNIAAAEGSAGLGAIGKTGRYASGTTRFGSVLGRGTPQGLPHYAVPPISGPNYSWTDVEVWPEIVGLVLAGALGYQKVSLSFVSEAVRRSH